MLVVEDESLIAEEIQDRLERLGHRATALVGSGEEAVQTAQRLRPDLVLMDIRLKGRLDGIEAAARIRERLDIPVIYLTAHSDDATLQRAKRTDPFGYLLKPFEERDRRVTIEMALHKHNRERRLKESEEKLATTLASIGDAVIATDAETRITFMNPAAEILTRWKYEEAHGMPLKQVFHIVHETTRTEAENPAQTALRQRKIVALADSTVLIARDGAEFPIEDSAAPITDSRSNVQGAVVVFRDISERKRAEKALREAEERFRQAQKMESIGRLAGGVAHDINNMMTVVNCGSEMVLGELGPNHPLRGTVEAIHQAGERATSITRQLLAFSRKQLLVPMVLDLNQVVQHAVQPLRRLIGANIEIITLLQPALRPVKADPMQLEHILRHLAVNARDAMPNGGRLTLETHNVDLDEAFVQANPEVRPGPHVMLVVRDTGCGMDEATRGHLFEPFFTTKDVGKGTGLGLAVVYGIIKQSGGFIAAESQPGRGTTFRIYLPDAEMAATEA
jgi:PAS domain S-box-containing protein